MQPFILFETGSAKWLASDNKFTSNRADAMVFRHATLESAIEYLGAERYADTIIKHDKQGNPI